MQFSKSNFSYYRINEKFGKFGELTMIYQIKKPSKLLFSIKTLKTVVAYMCQGNKYFTVCKQIIIDLPPFTL